MASALGFFEYLVRRIGMATNSKTMSKPGIKGNKWHHFKTHWLSKIAIPKPWRSRRALLVVLLLATSAAALTTLGVWRAVRPAPSLAPVNAASATGGAIKGAEPPATTNPPLTKLREYVYAGGRLITSEEKSCASTLSPTSANSPQGGGLGSFNVSTSSGCSWSAVPGASWITITDGLNGVGDDIVSYSVAPNSGPQRVETITVNGQSFTITQAPSSSSCNYSLDDTDEPVSEQGVSGSLTMTTGAGCAWTAVSNASWLTVTSPSGGNGNGTGPIGYSVVANNSGAQRTGVITAGGRDFTVTQPPNQASCTFALSPGSQSFTPPAGSGSFNVTTGAGCFWAADNTNGWITITGGATNPEGGGSGTVTFDVHANNGGSRTGTINVRG
jgi:hypothetical protein